MSGDIAIPIGVSDAPGYNQMAKGPARYAEPLILRISASL